MSAPRRTPHPPSVAAAPAASRGLLFVVAALVLVALNLRAGIASVPPLVSRLSDELGLGGVAAGLLTALPVLCMGFFAPAANTLAHRIGREAAMAVAVAILGVGLLLRWVPGLVPLYGGTFLAGVGIAVCGVVIPGVVKDFVPHRAGLVTGLYSTAMATGAAVAAGTAVPLASALGSWRAALAVWSVVAIVALVAWLPVVHRHNERGEDAESARLPWRSRTAWIVAVYLGLQSTLFYGSLAWIAPSYVALGWSPTDAGLLLSSFNLVGIAASLLVPPLTDRFTDRRPLFYAALTTAAVGFAFLAFGPTVAPWLLVPVLGFALGSSFPLGLVLLVDYAADPGASGRLSAMAFLVSYGTAAWGPLVLGGLLDLTGGYRVPFALLLAIAVVDLVVVTRLRPGRVVSG